jgi:GDP-L-fucose synthase
MLGPQLHLSAASSPPVSESRLLKGPLEPTNEPYAIAKGSGLKLCWSYNRQCAMNCIAVMLANPYGPGDNFDLPRVTGGWR